ncbi:MAG: carbohydrate binding domain-containing protein [Chitinispirillales bacterium]|jgi:uncharacterized repeat protein (TIGR02543 family)|nr:carbohydrate binding domain-containing protein [Chitinispirillales bacterium]
MKNHLAAVPTLVLAAAFALPLFAQQKFNEGVENVGADCPVTLPASFTAANAKLPDPFKKLDGARVSSMDEWWCRRQEILKLAERAIYGTKPPKPAAVTGTVSNTGISISVTDGGKTGTFSVSVSLPAAGTAPYPAIISYGNSGADAATIRGQGVAVINYTPTAVGAETGSRSKSGMFYDIYGASSKTGTLVAWAWGVSRIIDVIEQSDGKILRADAIGVTGCSRYGKGPFAAGAFDQRVALTIPVEGGTGGAAILRGAAKESGAQSPSSAFSEQPWLGDDFSAFQNNLNNLPIDMHEVVAMIAPRGLLILDKPSAADWLASRSGYASAEAGSEVYKALGFGGNITYHSNNNNGSHCAWISDWKAPVEDNIKRFLLRTQAPPSAPSINPRSDRAEDMSNWVDWTAPNLAGSLAIGGGGVTVSGFTLSTAASPEMGGTVNRSAEPANGRYDEGAVVTVTAVPNNGWAFVGWEGDAAGTAASAQIAMDKNKSVTAKFLPTADGADNLIKNGNFASTQNWTLNTWNGTSASFAVSGGSANITGITPASGANAADHNIQLVQNGIPLVKGMKYRLTFDASAASAREIGVCMEMDASPYTQYMSAKTVNLSAAKESFAYEFEMTEPSDGNSRLTFNFAAATANVAVSNVKLVYIAEQPSSVCGNNRNAKQSAPGQRYGLRASALSKSAVNVSFRAANSGAASVSLYNLKGKLVSAAKLQTSAGSSYSHTFNLGALPNGFYVVGVRSGGSFEQARVAIPK